MQARQIRKKTHKGVCECKNENYKLQYVTLILHGLAYRLTEGVEALMKWRLQMKASLITTVTNNCHLILSDGSVRVAVRVHCLCQILTVQPKTGC